MQIIEYQLNEKFTIGKYIEIKLVCIDVKKNTVLIGINAPSWFLIQKGPLQEKQTLKRKLKTYLRRRIKDDE